MSRIITTDVATRLEVSSGVLSSLPLTLAFWSKPVDAASAGIKYGLSLGSSASLEGSFLAYRDSSGRAGTLAAQDGGTGSGIVISTPLSDNVWYHHASVFHSTTDRKIYVNNAVATSETEIANDATINRTHIGVWQNGPGNFIGPWDGHMAEVGIWNIALSADEVASLVAGYSPMMVRPDALVGYWPCFSDGDEPDWVGENPMVEVTTTGVGFHPPQIVYPEGEIVLGSFSATDNDKFSLLHQGQVWLPSVPLPTP